jgi:hypothetical protein
MNMKQPTNSFSFKKNADVQALPEATPSVVKAALPRGKVGRPREIETATRAKQVSVYLSDEEFKFLTDKADGRPVSALVRRLVLDFIQNG